MPPDLRKLPDHLERKYGKIGSVYAQITFDKELVVGYTDLEFIGPGHPLFEGVVERVLQDYGSSLRQGAIFYNADATEPTVLWLLKCGVEDGRGHPVGERLFAIHLTVEKYRKSQPYALLDLKTPEAEPNVPTDIRQAATDEDRTIEWSLEEVTTAYFGKITDRRTRELAIKEKYVRKSLQFLISESAKKITKYDTQIRKAEGGGRRGEESNSSSALNPPPSALSLKGNRAQEEARRTELSLRLKDRLTEIEQERHISEKPPEIMGVAVILPPPRELVASVQGMVSAPEIERIAIEVAKQHEIDQGRKPVSVEEENCGCDLLIGAQRRLNSLTVRIEGWRRRISFPTIGVSGGG